jgi:Rad3-related DNA helicase
MSSLADDSAGTAGLADVAAPASGWDELSLADLRLYRRKLADEEEKVSYWRRLVHARIDVLEAEAHHERPLSIEELIRVLGDTGAGRTRTALVSVRAAADLPELPALADMWVTELDPNDTDEVADALTRLRAAEVQLTEYRHALHGRLDEATAELIRRYRLDPRSALVAFRAPHAATGRVGGSQ